MKRALLLLLFACNGGETPMDAGMDAGAEDPKWEVAFDATNVGWLFYVWGASANDVYAIGGAPTEGVIMRFDGGSWSEVETGLTFPVLYWCYGFGSNDVTFVGAQGTVLHFDGSTFSKQATPTDQDLWGVWGAAPDDLWSVGGRGTAPDQATILHFDGSGWTATSTPALARPNVFAFYKVWGTGSNDAYAVGQRGVLIHWNGTAWSEVTTGATDDLISLWGTAADRIVAIGGRDNGQALAFDGSTWRFQRLAPIPGLNGVWTRGSDFFLAGAQGTIARLDYGSLDYELEDTDTFLTLHGIFGVGDTLYAVGGSLLDIRPPYIGVALKRPLRE